MKQNVQSIIGQKIEQYNLYIQGGMAIHGQFFAEHHHRCWGL
jgi:hypothetical protein